MAAFLPSTRTLNPAGKGVSKTMTAGCHFPSNQRGRVITGDAIRSALANVPDDVGRSGYN